MNSMVMSKSEVVVLFDMLGVWWVPVGISNLPDVTELEYQRVMDLFSDRRLVDVSSEVFRPDKGLEKFLLPIIKAKSIMIFNYGQGRKCNFNSTLYFAESGLVSLIENQNNLVKFLTLSSIDDLLLFIPDISTKNINMDKSSNLYVSYILLLDEGVSIMHCTNIDVESSVARIVESKKTLENNLFEVTDVELEVYKKMLQCKLREVYSAAGC